MITEASYFAGVAVLAARLISYKNCPLFATRPSLRSTCSEMKRARQSQKFDGFGAQE